MRKFNNQAKRLVPFLILIFLLVFFFGKAIIGLEILTAGDFSGSDLLDLHYPFKSVLHQAATTKYLPLWSPYLDGGYPLLAEGEAGIFYPPNMLLSFLPPFLALNYSIILAFLFAGFFTYLSARSLKLDPFASLVAAITFMLSAFFIARIKHINLIAVASLFPLGFLLIQQFFEKVQIRFLVLFGIVLGLQILAGHPQMAFYCLLAYIWTFIFKLASYPKQQQAIPLGKAVVGFFLAGIFAVGISAVQILPTLELTAISSRAGYVFEQIAMYPYHPKNLITLLSPYFFGNPAVGTYRENIRQMGIFWENASYVGILPLVLAGLTIVIFIKKRKSLNHDQSLNILFFASTAILSLFLMLGQFTPLFSILTKTIPGLSLFRFPTRFNLFLIFSLSMLTGFGANFLLKTLAGPKFFRQFTWPLSQLRTQILIIFLIFIDLYTFGQDYIGGVPTNQWLKTPESVQILDEDKDLYRIYSLSQYAESPYQTLGWKRNTKPLLSIREAIPPDANLIYRIGSISSRGWFEGALPILRHYQFEKWLLNDIKDEFILGKILGMFNVKYLLTFSSTENPEFKLKKEITLSEEFGTTLKIYGNDQNIPRVYFVPEAKVVTQPDQILKEMADFNFYPFRTVILEKDPPVLPPVFGGVLDDFRKKNEVKITNYQPLKVEMTTNLENEGFLIFSDTNYPGWKAKVDNQDSEIFTANFLQRALYLKPGKHTIEFFFDPLSFKIGATITLITVSILCLSVISIPVKMLLVYFKLKIKYQRSKRHRKN